MVNRLPLYLGIIIILLFILIYFELKLIDRGMYGTLKNEGQVWGGLVKMFEEVIWLFNLSKVYWYISIPILTFFVYIAFRYFILVDNWD